MKIASHGKFKTHIHARAHAPLATLGRVIGKNTGVPGQEGGRSERKQGREAEIHREENGRRSTAAGYDGGSRQAEGERGGGSGYAIKRGEYKERARVGRDTFPHALAAG